jgi:MFS family permease
VFLIITRMIQGVGAALLAPGSLVTLEASFVPADRAQAIGAWSARAVLPSPPRRRCLYSG